MTDRFSPVFFLVVEPSLAILDQWLPVIHSIKRVDSNAKFYAVILRDKVALKTRTINALIACANDLFDGVFVIHGLLPSRNQNQICYFHEQFSKSPSVKAFRQDLLDKLVFNRALRRLADVITRGFIPLIFKFVFLKNKVKLDSFLPQRSVVLTDIRTFADHGDCGYIEFLKGHIVGCLPHGPGVAAYTGTSIELPKIPENVSFNVFIESSDQIENYRRKFGTDRKLLSIVGAPKYSKGWPGFLSNFSHMPVGFDRYIFITSKPTLDQKCPHEEKARLIRHIKEVSDKYDLPIVFRLHPKESKESTRLLLNDVFGSESFNTSWMFDTNHALVSARNAIFAVHFSTNMPLDTARLGVPSIVYREKSSREYWARGIETSDGVYICPAEKEGLALCAYDENSFFQCTDTLFKDLPSEGKRQYNNYVKFYGGDDTNAAALVASKLVSQIETFPSQEYQPVGLQTAQS